MVCLFHDARSDLNTATASTTAANAAPATAADPGLRASRIARVYLCHSVLLAHTAARRKARADWQEWLQSDKGRFERARLGAEAEEAIGREVLVEAVLQGLQPDPRYPSSALIYVSAADDSGGGGDGWDVGEGDCSSRKATGQPASQSQSGRGEASVKGQSAAQSMDPNLGGKPAGLSAAPIDVVQLSQLWQIEQAVARVDHSTAALCASVRHCERMADVLEATISMFVYRIKVRRPACVSIFMPHLPVSTSTPYIRFLMTNASPFDSPPLTTSSRLPSTPGGPRERAAGTGAVGGQEKVQAGGLYPTHFYWHCSPDSIGVQ